jgi:hypothetical protein
MFAVLGLIARSPALSIHSLCSKSKGFATHGAKPFFISWRIARAGLGSQPRPRAPEFQTPLRMPLK